VHTDESEDLEVALDYVLVGHGRRTYAPCDRQDAEGVCGQPVRGGKHLAP
jgi:hypothetical protein